MLEMPTAPYPMFHNPPLSPLRAKIRSGSSSRQVGKVVAVSVPDQSWHQRSRSLVASAGVSRGEGRSGRGHHWGQPPVARDPKGVAVGREVVEAVLDAAENLRWQCCVRGEGNEAGVKRDGGGMGAPLRVGQGAGDAVGCQRPAAKAVVGQRRLADKAGQTARPSGYSAGPLTFSLLPKGTWK